jgi:hypothetical protein
VGAAARVSPKPPLRSDHRKSRCTRDLFLSHFLIFLNEFKTEMLIYVGMDLISVTNMLIYVDD